jgi:hypothetical protein
MVSTASGRFLCVDTYRIKQNEPIRPDQIDTASTSFTAQQENKLFALWIVETINKLLTLVDVHCAIQSQTSISVTD